MEEDPSETLFPGIVNALFWHRVVLQLGFHHFAINLMSEIWLPQQGAACLSAAGRETDTSRATLFFIKHLKKKKKKTALSSHAPEPEDIFCLIGFRYTLYRKMINT